MTADELARIWPERWPRPDAVTTKQNERMVRKFGRDFAHREITGIDREEAREWALANLAAARYVRSMFNDAVSDGLVEANVFAALKLPMPGEEPVVVPTYEQLRELTGAARGSGDFLLAARIEFAAYVGLRFAEQQAILLPGQDGALGNDFASDEFKRLDIAWQMGRDGKLKRPKTSRSLRVVLVPKIARAAAHEAIGDHPVGAHSGFLWPGSRDKHRRAWSALRRETGIWFKWHNLRHFAATWFLDKGASYDDVAKQLGCHVDVVRDRYGHPDQEKALARLESLVDDA